MSQILVLLDKVLGTLGDKKAQKGFFVTAITTALMKFFPDFPQSDLTVLIETGIVIFNAAGTFWGSLGIVHQWVKDRIIARGAIPASVTAQAEAGGTVVVVKPGK